MSTLKPLFVFSLPRSGSTLVQRVLGSHPEIHTVSETWLLLPFIYALKERGVFAEYNNLAMVRAIKDFCITLPNGEADYLASVQSCVQQLYEKASPPESTYFLDKTPRYHLVVDDIISMFPDAKFIFLWRNPLAIAASINDLYAGGRWRFYDFRVDLYEGMNNLVEAYMANRDKAIAVRYEDVIGDDGEWKRVFDYLDLNFDEELLSGFSKVKLKGRMGDPTGTKAYTGLSSEPLEKWKGSLAGPLRKLWARRYLRWIGAERLQVMGYDIDELMLALETTPTQLRSLPSDVARITYGATNCWLEPYMLRYKLKRIPDWRRMYSHR